MQARLQVRLPPSNATDLAGDWGDCLTTTARSLLVVVTTYKIMHMRVGEGGGGGSDGCTASLTASLAILIPKHSQGNFKGTLRYFKISISKIPRAHDTHAKRTVGTSLACAHGLGLGGLG